MTKGELYDALFRLVHNSTDRAKLYNWLKTLLNVNTKKIETFTIAVSDWSSMSGNEPFTYSTEIIITTTIGNDTILELINDQAVNFAKYGFAIGDTAGQSIKLFAMELPEQSVTLKINIY